MATPEQIRKRLEEMAAENGPAVSNIAKVKSVDRDAQTCILEDENGLEFFDVRLHPVLTGNKSCVLVPKSGSYALAIRVEDDDDWMVIACDEIEEIAWHAQSSILEISDKVHIESGGESMATLMDDLFEAIGAMSFSTPDGVTTALLNAPQFEAIKTRFKTLLK